MEVGVEASDALGSNENSPRRCGTVSSKELKGINIEKSKDTDIAGTPSSLFSDLGMSFSIESIIREIVIGSLLSNP